MANNRNNSSSANNRTNSGKFKSGDKRTSDAGKRGAAAQPTEAKRLGGQRSHRNSG